MPPPDGSLSTGSNLGLSGALTTVVPAYSGTPGPGPAPSPWKQKGPTVFYDEGGVTSPLGVPGGTKGKGTYNAEGLFVNGQPVGVAGMGEPPIGPAGGDLTGAYPNPAIKPGINGQFLATMAGIAGWINLPTFPATLPPSGPAGGALSGTYPNPGLAVPYPTTLPPTGPAGGALAGTYPNPTLSVPYPTTLPPSGPAGGALSGTYPNPGLAAPYPTTLPPSGPAGGDLAGTYPNPTLKAIQQAASSAAGGTQDAGLLWSNIAHLGIVFGTGVPNKVQARGTWYQRTDTNATNPPLYFNVDGTATGWIPFSPGGTVAVGTTPPAVPADNSLWFYTDAVNGGGVLYIYYNDGNSIQWVPCSPLPSATVIPPGAIMDFAGAVAPAGWLLCDGSLLSRTAYSGLFAAIGTTYGAGDGTTNFAIPDARGRVTAAPDGTAGRLTVFTATLGATGGDQNLVAHAHGPGTLQTADHLHAAGSVTAPSHAHTFTMGNTTPASYTARAGQGDGGNVYDQATAAAGPWTTYGSTGAADRLLYLGGATANAGAGAAQNIPPTLIVNKLIKT
jgi:microcystin-dependent protein